MFNYYYAIMGATTFNYLDSGVPGWAGGPASQVLFEILVSPFGGLLVYIVIDKLGLLTENSMLDSALSAIVANQLVQKTLQETN